MAPLRRHCRARRDRAKEGLLAPRESPARTCTVCTTGHVRATGQPMGMRVLGVGNWYRPGWVGAGCDAQGAWAVRGTRKGVHERSAVTRSGHR
eukprot:scaffold6818_cov60-Phaeocystis_antarctica.AAC.4